MLQTPIKKKLITPSETVQIDPNTRLTAMCLLSCRVSLLEGGQLCESGTHEFRSPQCEGSRLKVSHADQQS